MNFVLRELNTFLTLVQADDSATSQKRGSSVPPSSKPEWKSTSHFHGKCDLDNASESTDAVDDVSVSGSDGSSFVSAPPARERQTVELCLLLPACNRVTPLRKSAKSYEPDRSKDVGSVLDYLRVFASRLPHVMGALVSENHNGYELTVQVHRNVKLSIRQDIRDSMKSGLAAACDRSTSVHLKPCGGSPFQETPKQRFSASLCVVPERSAPNLCWGAMQTGRCNSQWCQWLHPEDFKNVDVMFGFDSV